MLDLAPPVADHPRVAVYTDISDAELDAFLADYDLGRPLTFKGIAEGVENSNYLLETERARCILTLYERRVAEGDLPFFIDLMRWLAERGFPCPVPVADRQGVALKRLAGKPAALVSFLTGLSVRRPNAQHCRETGAALARMHQAAAGFPTRRPNALGHAAWGDLYAPLTAEAERVQPGLDAAVRGDLDALQTQWPDGLPWGVIHADLFPDNAFFIDGRFAAAIDFYFACEDALAYDLAICLNAWCFQPDGQFNVTHARALVGGYQAVRPLTAEERSGLPILARGAAMRFFLTRLADWGRGADGAMVQPKDPLDYVRRLDFHRAAAGRLGLFDEEAP